jgi:hypothetical protein
MEDMENNIINDLKEKYPIDELVKFNELDISEKIRENTGLILKYRDLYHHSLAEMDRLSDLNDKLSCKRYKHYRFDVEEGWTKPEIEKHCLPGDRKLIRMKKILRRQEIKLRFFEMCWKAFENRTWAMKLFVETLKGY